VGDRCWPPCARLLGVLTEIVAAEAERQKTIEMW
jgi:hypothetical protein